MAYSFAVEANSRKTVVGYAAAAVTVVIWASWLVVTRHSASIHLGTIELGLFRFGIPAIALAPVWVRHGVLPKSVPLHVIALMVMGSGALFFQVTAHGIHNAEAGFSGILLGGAMPFSTAMLALSCFARGLTG